MLVDLTRLKSGQKGTIVNIQWGQALAARLLSMGIRPGKKITKVSAQFIRGPQVICLGHLKIAVGYGVAKKIFVEVQE